MRKFLLILTFLGGLWAAAGVCAQDRAEPVEGSARSVDPHQRMPPRGESLRSQPPAIDRSRPGQYLEDLTPRSRTLDTRQREDLQRLPPRDDLRDPRQITFRTRPMPGDSIAPHVSRDLQRAIEQAQSEHGGKVLSADRIRFRGRDTYRVKLLTPSGRVRVVQLSKQAAPEAAAPNDHVPDHPVPNHPVPNH